jgi:hypothetical protein
MTYNFTDDASPSLHTTISGPDVELVAGSTQVELITTAFSGTTVSVSIEPPSGWTLTSVSWSPTGRGILPVPNPGSEDTHNFNYTVSQNGTSMTNGGVFKIKRPAGS